MPRLIRVAALPPRTFEADNHVRAWEALPARIDRSIAGHALLVFPEAAIPGWALLLREAAAAPVGGSARAIAVEDGVAAIVAGSTSRAGGRPSSSTQPDAFSRQHRPMRHSPLRWSDLELVPERPARRAIRAEQLYDTHGAFAAILGNRPVEQMLIAEAQPAPLA